MPHLDRTFDYSIGDIPSVSVGQRVRVRFSGRLVTGFVVALKAESEFPLQPLREVKGPPVLPAPALRLTREVAARYVGSWYDVAAAAVPPRHVRAERAVTIDGDLPAPLPIPATGAPVGDAEAWGARLPQRSALAIPWGWHWGDALCGAAARTLAAGRRVLVVVPDERDIATAKTALSRLDPAPRVVGLSAQMGPQARYRSYLLALSGQADVVVGTRAASFTEIPQLGLIWLWNDGDDALIDPQSPYWHARDVCLLRAHQEGVDLCAAGWTRTCEVQRLVDLGWLTEHTPDRATWRASSPHVQVPALEDQHRDPAALVARIPSTAFSLIRRAVREGPVLVQVARRGYVPLVSCQECRALALCEHCGAGLSLEDSGGEQRLRCLRCRVGVGQWRCGHCGGARLRAVRVGSGRTAVELAKAFPDLQIVRSDAEEGVVASIGGEPAIVVATPGAAPAVESGYSGVVLLDGDALAHAPRLRAGEEALSRWAEALAGLKPDAPALLVADPRAPVVQALVRADPIGWASRELGLRTEAQLPPAVKVVALAGLDAGHVAQQVARTTGATPLGPLTSDDGERWLVRATYQQAPGVYRELDRLRRRRSERRDPVVSIRVDPASLE